MTAAAPNLAPAGAGPGHRSASSVEAGRFITFEGGEGGGKTTQILRLAEQLQRAGISVVTTREPGGTPLAEAIRKFILSGAARSLGPDGETILFGAARADHVERLIRPALERGDWVLCDRFTDSTRAYQGAAGVDPQLIRALERITVGQTRPDVTVILDVPAEVGLRRAAQRSGGAAPDRFESDPADLQSRRRDIFLAIARAEPDRCVVVDAAQPEKEVAAAIWDAVLERLAKDPASGRG